jgi:hypothetical protein
MRTLEIHRMNPQRLAIALLLAMPLVAEPARAAATGFVYEGRLDDGGAPANGRYDLRLSPFADAKSADALAMPLVLEDVPVVDGRFRIDFELPLSTATAAWIEVGVRDGAAVGAFSTIPGRSESTAAKAIGACWSSTGDSATNPAVNFLGTTDAQPLVLRVQNQSVARYAPSSFLSGGVPATANVIAGAAVNGIFSGVQGAVIAGGGMPPDSDPLLAGEAPNRVNDDFGTVGGGYANLAGDQSISVVTAAFATVGGGAADTASGYASSIAGGIGNQSSQQGAFVGGGFTNQAAGELATVTGGSDNVASGSFSAVGGGSANQGVNRNATVAGVQANAAIGQASTVAGGAFNCAGGAHSFAGGIGARVRRGTEPARPVIGDCAALAFTTDTDGDQGTFVWSSRASGFTSSGAEQFLVDAIGGAAINSNDPAGNALRVGGTLRVDALGSTGMATLCRNANNQVSTCSSSARYKQHITDLELGLAVVERLCPPVAYEWKSTREADIGFVAEEIAAIDPRLVTRNAAGDVEGVKYERLTAVLAVALKDLDARLEAIERQLGVGREENP